MLLDRLDRLHLYRGLHPLVAASADWLARTDLTTLAPGRCPIQGDDLFGIVEERASRDGGLFETHRVYADIQMNLVGGERMRWWPEPTGPVVEQPGPDAWFHADPPGPAPLIEVPQGHFAIFLPGEAHLPLLHPATGPTQLRKCVLKLRW